MIPYQIFVFHPHHRPIIFPRSRTLINFPSQFLFKINFHIFIFCPILWNSLRVNLNFHLKILLLIDRFHPCFTCCCFANMEYCIKSTKLAQLFIKTLCFISSQINRLESSIIFDYHFSMETQVTHIPKTAPISFAEYFCFLTFIQ